MKLVKLQNAYRSSIGNRQSHISFVGVPLCRVLDLRTLAENYPHSLPPPLVNSHQRPVDLGGDVVQQGVCGGMDVQRRRDQK